MSRTSTWTWKKIRTATIRAAIEQGQTNCPLCRTWLDYNNQRMMNSPEVDHIIPYAQGGQDTLDNVRVICKACNRRLGGKDGNKRRRLKEAEQAFEPKKLETTFEW